MTGYEEVPADELAAHLDTIDAAVEAIRAHYAQDPTEGLYRFVVAARDAARAEQTNHPEGSPRRWYWEGRTEALAGVMTELERRGMTR